MRIKFLGAARTVTGSMHMIEINGRKLILECGLFQGKRKEAFERNRNLPVNANDIDACILSHAHIDHSGNLPTLVKRGFKGRIYCTPATRDLCEIMLRDSAHLQMRDVEYVNRKRKKQGKNPFEPLYEMEDVDATLKLLEPFPYGVQMDVLPGVKATFQDAGHLLGSAFVSLELEENGRSLSLFFTGDMGRPDMPILRDPDVVKSPDVLITESTYGNREHPPKADIKTQLESILKETVDDQGKLIIPAFSVGRTQQLLYFLRELHYEKRIPNMPVYVDSPLSTRATDVYLRHPECYDPDTRSALLNEHEPFSFRGVRFVTATEDSKALNTTPGPIVIISASEMCAGGRILHHLANNIEDPTTRILFVGFQAENTLGRRLVEGTIPIRIFGDEFEPKAQVHVINALSAHADRNEIMDYFRSISLNAGKAFVVHGEVDQAEALAEGIREMGVAQVTVPEPGWEEDL